MEQKIRVTVEATILDDDTLERIKKSFEGAEEEFNKSNELKDAKVTFEVL